MNQSIPYDGSFATAEFTLTTTAAPIEDILITLTIDSNVELYLTSPSGTTSRLSFDTLESGMLDGGAIEWTFLANAFWGEDGAGTWTINVTDVLHFGNESGKWLSFGVEAHFGELVAVPEPSTSILLTLSGVGLLISRRRARAKAVTSTAIRDRTGLRKKAY